MYSVLCLGDLDVDGKKILEWILRKHVGRCGLDASGSRQGPVASPCEVGNGPYDSKKGGQEFLN